MYKKRNCGRRKKPIIIKKYNFNIKSKLKQAQYNTRNYDVLCLLFVYRLNLSQYIKNYMRYHRYYHSPEVGIPLLQYTSVTIIMFPSGLTHFFMS